MRLISKPVLCNYYVTYRCNATCDFCDIWEKPSPYVTLENAADNLFQLKQLGVKVVDFTGGEPLLHRNIDELLLIAKRMGMVTTLTTNALLYPKWAERLKGLVDMLHFSLDSADAETHDKSRGVKCFNRVMESIEIAKSLGERPDILFTVFEENYAEMQQVYERICKPNKLMLILNPVFEYNDVNTRSSAQSESRRQMFADMRRIAKLPGVYLNEAFLALRENGGNSTTQPVCRAGSSTIVISPMNELVLPCYHLGMQSLPIENNLYDLWHSQKVQDLISLEGRLPECEGCVINCYMQPSFAVELSQYWFKALPSTMKYNAFKGLPKVW